MTYVVMANRDGFGRKCGGFVEGQVMSVHTGWDTALTKCQALLKETRLSGGSREDFVYFEVLDPIKKGDVRADLLDAHRARKRDETALGLMRAVLAPELGERESLKPQQIADGLVDLGMTIEELRELYEQRAREAYSQDLIDRQNAAERAARGYKELEKVKTIRGEITYTFPAVRGIQAGKEFYVAMVPYAILVRLFVFDDELVPAELRAQRTLNERRAEGIATYVADNPDTYVLPALTASVSASIHFEPSPLPGASDRVGHLHIPMDAVMLINDGQHRRKGIELAMAKNPLLSSECVAVTIYFDQGLVHSQQMFSDINGKQVKPSGAINALYDHRNPFNTWVMQILKDLPTVKRRIDFENSTVPAKSMKLWSILAFRKFVSLLTGVTEKAITELDAQRLEALRGFVVRFVGECTVIPHWAEMMDGKITAVSVRESMVIGHAVWLEALGMFGNRALFDWPYLLATDPNERFVDPDRARWEDVMPKLASVDPMKDSSMWQGRCVHLGKMQKTTDGVKSTAAQLLKLADMTLPEDLQKIEERLAEL